MKFSAFVLAAVLLCSSPVFAYGDKIDEAKMTAFMKAFPEYEALCMKYGEAVNVENMDMAIAYKYKSEFDAIFAKYGMTLESFAVLINKVGMGYSVSKMKEEGVDPSAIGFDTTSIITPEEIAVVGKHSSELDRIFHKQ